LIFQGCMAVQQLCYQHRYQSHPTGWHFSCGANSRHRG